MSRSSLFALALVFAAGTADAGSFAAAKGEAVRALKRAAKDVRSRTTCEQSQGANIRDALRRARAIDTRTSPGEPEDLRLFLAGLSLGAAFSGCPDSLYANITAAQSALSEVGAALQRPAPVAAPAYDDYEDEYEPRRARKGVVADVLVDPDAVGKRRQPALLVRATDVEAFGLRGQRLAWSLRVKPAHHRTWRKARKYSIGKTWVKQRAQRLGDVELTLRYATMARDGLRPGPHDAALVATLRGREVFRDELRFELPDLRSRYDVEREVALRAHRSAPPPRGPHAMNPRAFQGFASSIKSTSSDLSRVDMIKSAARKNHFTADQLGVLLDATNSELSKMDVAKAIVPRLVDPENAWGLSSKFRSSLSREEYTGLLGG